MASLQLHPRVSNIKPSATLGVKAKAKALRDQGREVIDLSAGEPDLGRHSASSMLPNGLWMKGLPVTLP